MTFLSISLGVTFCKLSLSNENRLELNTLVGVDGADWNLLFKESLFY